MTIQIPDDLARGLEAAILAGRLPVDDQGAFDGRQAG
jgi:hypothetical protein